MKVSANTTTVRVMICVCKEGNLGSTTRLGSWLVQTSRLVGLNWLLAVSLGLFKHTTTLEKVSFWKLLQNTCEDPKNGFYKLTAQESGLVLHTGPELQPTSGISPKNEFYLPRNNAQDRG